MPDITMCSGKNCKDRKYCYRHRAIPSMRQSMFSTPPCQLDDKDDTGRCTHFVKTIQSDKLAEYRG